MTPRTTTAAALIAAYCRTKGYPEPATEYRFHPGRRWAFDAAWVPELVALEFEGGVWTGGRHTRGKGFTADIEKYNEAAVAGWRVLRATYDQVDSGLVYRWLDAVFGAEPSK